jgi:hypothetical protein
MSDEMFDETMLTEDSESDVNDGDGGQSKDAVVTDVLLNDGVCEPCGGTNNVDGSPFSKIGWRTSRPRMK